MKDIKERADSVYYMYAHGREMGANLMNIRHLTSLVLVFFLISVPAFAAGQSLVSNSGANGNNPGRSKLSASKQIRPMNVPAANSNSNTDRGFGNNNDTRHESGNPKNNWHGGNNHWHDKDHHDKGHHNFNPLYAPYYYFGYYGYAPYNGYYAYVDPEYPLGYGTTMGTSLERPSNIEINRYNEGAPAPPQYREDDSDTDYPYSEPTEDTVVENYNPPPSREQTIYVWVDESGVQNYANDIDLVPLRYRDIVTIMGAE